MSREVLLLGLVGEVASCVLLASIHLPVHRHPLYLYLTIEMTLNALLLSTPPVRDV